MGVPPKGPGVIGRPSRRSNNPFRKVWEAFLEVQVWSGGPLGGPGGLPGGPKGLERPSQRSGRVWEAFSKVQEWSGVPPEGPGVV